MRCPVEGSREVQKEIYADFQGLNEDKDFETRLYLCIGMSLLLAACILR